MNEWTEVPWWQALSMLLSGAVLGFVLHSLCTAIADERSIRRTIRRR